MIEPHDTPSKHLAIGEGEERLGKLRGEGLHGGPGVLKRRIKTQCALPNAETAAMLFWALMASGQITMRKVDGWQALAQAPTAQPLDHAA